MIFSVPVDIAAENLPDQVKSFTAWANLLVP
jgi:hypothetical protein